MQTCYFSECFSLNNTKNDLQHDGELLNWLIYETFTCLLENGSVNFVHR